MSTKKRLRFQMEKKRLKVESSVLSRFRFSNFSSFLGHVFLCEFLSAVIEICVCSKSHSFLFIKSKSLKIRSHLSSTIGPGKEGLASTLGS